MHQILTLLGLGIASYFVSSCSTDRHFEERLAKAIDNNPDIILSAIKKNPKKFIKTFEVAFQETKRDLNKNHKEKERQALSNYIKNPLEPYIGKEHLIRGAKDAPITIVEYSDFECPFCAKGRNSIEAVMKKYPGKVRVVFKHLPLKFHPSAMISAKYYEAVSLQSPQKAYKFHDQVFANQKKLKQGETYLTQLAKSLNLDMVKLNKDVYSVKVKAKIDDDIKEANKFNFQGTPGYLINGIPVKGAYPAEYFEHIITKLQENGSLVL